jgi:hypothetical protein
MSELPNDQSSGYQNDDKSPMKDDGMDSFTVSQSAARKKKKPSSGHVKAKGNNKNQKKMKPPVIKPAAEEVGGP